MIIKSHSESGMNNKPARLATYIHIQFMKLKNYNNERFDFFHFLQNLVPHIEPSIRLYIRLDDAETKIKSSWWKFNGSHPRTTRET